MKILVFRVGQLGDTLAALPAFWTVREHFKHDQLTLLSDVQHGKNYVVARDLLEGSGLFDAFLTYEFHSKRTARWLSMARLLKQLRAQNFDALVYLYPAQRSQEAVARDRRFFRVAGINHFIGMNATYVLPPKQYGEPLPHLSAEAELTLARLVDSEISVPMRGKLRTDLNLGESEERAVDAWLKGLPPDGGRPWIGIGPGSKMPSKIWPTDRFRDVVARLIKSHNIWPVVFGGSEDDAVAHSLLKFWKRGYNAAGILSLRAAAAALRRCKIYLGNDTGTMHLAAAVKIPCVAVFSARDYPGRWYPYGVQSRILRKSIDCEGCMLTECIERKMECLTRISVDEVEAACRELLDSVPEKIAR